jgi:hypothetical protein
VGASVGAIVVGTTEGVSVGLPVITETGEAVGVSVGIIVVGTADGVTVGLLVGSVTGEAVGTLLAPKVGDTVEGLEVGTAAALEIEKRALMLSVEPSNKVKSASI